MQDSVRQSQIGSRIELDEHIGVLRRRRPARGDVDDAHGRVEALVFEDAAEQDRMHLGHVVPPHHKVVAGFKVVVAAHGLVALKLRYETHHGTGHAEPRIGIDVVALHAAFDPLQSGIAIKDCPLTGAVHRYRLRTVILQSGLELFCDQIQRRLPRDSLEPLSIRPAFHGELQTVFAVQHGRQVIAFDAKQPAIHRALAVSTNGVHAPIANTDFNATTRPAVTTGGFAPFQRRIGRVSGNLLDLRIIAAGGEREGTAGNAQLREKFTPMCFRFTRR